MMDWQGYLKRYVWDDETTPYFVPVPKLSREQADNELFFFAVMLAVLFSVLTLAAITGKLPYGKSEIGAVYAFSVVVGAALLGTTRHVYAAAYCAGAPLSLMCVMFFAGFPPQTVLVDELVFLAVLLLLLRYCMRVIRITQIYATLKSRPPKNKPRRKLF